jgi:Fe-S cluster biogenesis protein NfuA
MAGRSEKSSIHKLVAEALDGIRPAVQRDGGDVELVDVDVEGVVCVRLHGACIGCPSSEVTLTQGVERNLRERVPGVSKVVRIA